MTDFANRSFLRLCVAKICQDVGFNSIQSTPLEVLTDLLQDYMTALAKTAYNYALHCGNTEPNLNHLALAFRDMGVSINELKEYVRYVDSSSVVECPKYPISKESHLNLLKPGSREVVTRPFHIHEHLPPMHPHLEDQDLSVKQESNVDNSPESTSPVSSSKCKTFKRPGDPITEGLPNKRNRYVCEEEGRPLRELSSVMMTTSGFLSPAREGKLPEARTPLVKSEFPINQEAGTQAGPEVKSKKKGKLSPDVRKSDNKDAKLTSEKEVEPIVKDEEPIKQKKPNTGKDLNKKSSKTASSKSSLSNSVPVISSPKVHKINKQKNAASNAVTLNPLHVPKSIKVKSPKNERNIEVLDAPMQALSNQVPPEYKISSEPDKQKLNIIKKISKVKEDTLDEPDENQSHSTDPDSLCRVDVTIEFVIKREMCAEASSEQDTDMKDEVVDIETVHSPGPYETLISNNNEEAADICVPQSNVTTLSLGKLEKKKKKIKKLSKKDNVDVDFNVKTLKSVADFPVVHENEPIIETVHTNASTLIPATVPIIPEKIPSPSPPPTLSINVAKKEVSITPIVSHVISEPNPSKNHGASQDQNNLITSSEAIIKTEDPILEAVVKKKLHKKEKKDKLKKKKKEKLKNKEKSEKRKLKLEKKVKDKEKQRIKKEKKEKRKEKESEESKMDCTNSVPKITLKLGPASPTNSTDSNSRKIVIIPGKKETEPSKPERAPSPELARFAPLVPNPKQKINKNSFNEDIKINNDVKLNDHTDSPSIPTSSRLDSEVNKVWICPTCERQDDGSPMVGCDECDEWYHWVCVGIKVAPQSIEWYCNTCLNKKKSLDLEKKKKGKKKNISKKGKIH